MSTEAASLQRRLLRQFLLLSLLPLCVVIIVGVALLLPALVTNGEARNLELATAVRDQVQQQLAARQRAAVWFANEVDSGRLSDGELTEALHSMLRQDRLLLAAYLTTDDGRVEYVALPEGSQLHEADMLGLDQSSQTHFSESRRTRQPVWSATFLSLLTGRITAVLVVPAGRRMLVTELALDSLSQSLIELGEAAQTQAVVIDRIGQIIGHADPKRALRQENLRSLDLVQAATRGHSGAGRLSLDGIDYLAQVLPVAPVGWSILVLQPTRILLAPLWSLAWLMLFTLSVVVGLAVWLAWLLASRSGREVVRLAEAAEAAAGLHAAAPSKPFEIAEFRAVWSRLQSLFSELHLRDKATDNARRDLQQVLDAATQVAIIATDTAGLVTVFSNGAQKMLGWRTPEVVGALTPLAWHDADEVSARGDELSRQLGYRVEGLEVFMAQSRHSGYEVRDWTCRPQTGGAIDVSLAVTAMRSPEGDLKGFLFVAVDVSERRRAAELELARRSAEAANQAKSAFLSRMSHELRTPLNAVLGFAQVIDGSRTEPPTEQQRHHLQQILRSGWHLVQLIDDVLDLARIESGQMRMLIEPVDPVLAIQRATEMSASIMNKYGVTCTVQWPADSDAAWRGPVLADKTRLTQVLVNLLGNAAKYNRPGGLVRLELAQRPDHRLALRVIDNGRGMSSAQLAQLYQPFNRLGLEGSEIEGSGIGLVITRHLVELMQGSIEVDSQPGVGSVFSVVLRQQAGLDSRTGAAASAGQAIEAPAPAPGTGRVLYIEDNDVNAMLMREVMRQRPNISLQQAATAGEGLRLARLAKPDLLLLDMHLPDADGFEVLAQIQEDPGLRGLPVIVVSADATHSQMGQALAQGARAYLTKPINVPDALAAIDDALVRGMTPDH